jgi:hypothetical protein
LGISVRQDADEVEAGGTKTITGLAKSSFEQRGERHLFIGFLNYFLKGEFAMSGLNN